MASAQQPARTAEGASAETPLARVIPGRDRLVLALPPSTLGRELVQVQRFATGTSLFPALRTHEGFATVAVVRWLREGDSVALYEHTLPYGGAFSGRDTLRRRVPIVRAEPDGTLWVDVTAEYLTPLRAYIDTAASPEPRALRVLMDRPAVQGGRGFATHVEFETRYRIGSGAFVVHWSLLALPATPMRPRLAPAVRPNTGPNLVLLETTASAQVPLHLTPDTAQARQYVVRYRLVKRNPAALVSPVVHPIVFSLDPRIPRRWVPWVKQGVLAWRPVLQSLGFQDAIVVRDAPRGADSTWSVYDGSNSAIIWAPQSTELGRTSHVLDPRSGEVLQGTVVLFGGIENLLTRRYLALGGGIDPRIRTLPLPTTILGPLIQAAVSHEVGHALGLHHNFWARYPIDSVRRAAFVRRYGFTPAIMGYTWGNTLAQLTDSMPLSALVPRISQADRAALSWAYLPIPSAASPEDERPQLAAWTRDLDTAVYASANWRKWPSRFDPVETARLQILNFARVAMRLLTWRAGLPPEVSAAGATLPASPTPSPGQAARTLDALYSQSWTAVNRAQLNHYQATLLRYWYEAMQSVLEAQSTESFQQTLPDTAAHIAALRFVLDHVFRAQDAFVRTALLAPAGLDTIPTAALTLDTLPVGGAGGMQKVSNWSRTREEREGEDWHAFQTRTLQTLLDHAATSANGGTPALREAYCRELTALAAEFAAAEGRGGTAETNQWLSTTYQKLQTATAPGGVVCRTP